MEDPVPCPSCDGKGHIFHVPSAPIWTDITASLPTTTYSSTSYPPYVIHCPTCHGRGMVERSP